MSFVIFMPETDQYQAKPAVQKLRRLLLEAMQTRSWPVTFSIGVYTFHKPPGDVSAMIQRVDELMYNVKRSTKNDVSFAFDMASGSGFHAAENTGVEPKNNVKEVNASAQPRE